MARTPNLAETTKFQDTGCEQGGSSCVNCRLSWCKFDDPALVSEGGSPAHVEAAIETQEKLRALDRRPLARRAAPPRLLAPSNGRG